jgi:FecR protein
MVSRVKPLFLILSLAILSAPVFGANPARPGTINYVEGSALLAGQPVTQKSVGTLALDPGQVLSTEQGHAEILLTPGIYLRLDDDSSVRMISPNLTSTQLALDKGRATVEVDEIHPQNDVQIIENGVPTQLLKTGLYEFNAGNGTASVFDGKATAHEGSKRIDIKGDRQLALSEDLSAKPQHFDKNASKDELYNWSSLRSEYLAEANSELSGYYPATGYAPGWYWNPWFYGYTFIGPYPFDSPFGWGFYPFGYYGFGGYYGRGSYGRGFYGRPYHNGGHYVAGAPGFEGGMHGTGFAGGHAGGFAGGGHR